jgi:hypothetical protein
MSAKMSALIFDTSTFERAQKAARFALYAKRLWPQRFPTAFSLKTHGNARVRLFPTTVVFFRAFQGQGRPFPVDVLSRCKNLPYTAIATISKFYP